MADEQIPPIQIPIQVEVTALVTSPTIVEFAKALSAAQGEMGTAKKTATNPFLKSSYADLAEVRSVWKDPFAKHGLSVVQAPQVVRGRGVVVTTRILHVSGEWMQCTIEATPKSASPQEIGAVITYLRRYGASSLAGVVSEGEDEDGGKPDEHDDKPKQAAPPPPQEKPAPVQKGGKPGKPPKQAPAAERIKADAEMFGKAKAKVESVTDAAGLLDVFGRIQQVDFPSNELTHLDIAMLAKSKELLESAKEMKQINDMAQAIVKIGFVKEAEEELQALITARASEITGA